MRLRLLPALIASLQLISSPALAADPTVADLVAAYPEQFAGIVPELPLNDDGIADLLQCSRQQVINLRAAAQRRLARRMRPFEGPP